MLSEQNLTGANSNNNGGGGGSGGNPNTAAAAAAYVELRDVLVYLNLEKYMHVFTNQEVGKCFIPFFIALLSFLQLLNTASPFNTARIFSTNT